MMYRLTCCLAAAATADGAASTQCTATTAMLQKLIDTAASAVGGGYAQIPCGFHATLALTLPSGVRISSANCVPQGGQVPTLLTLGACARGEQQHIIAVANGTGQMISGVIFDHTNLTDPSTRTSCAVTGGGGAQGFVLEHSQFLNINMTSQGFSAIQMAGCSGCTIRGTANCNTNGHLLGEFSIENAEIMENCH